MRRLKTISARREFAALCRLMPLSVMVPTTAGLTLTLPASGLPDDRHDPFGGVVTIAGIKDLVDVMSSLQRPKKARPPCVWQLFIFSLAVELPKHALGLFLWMTLVGKVGTLM